MLEVLAYPSWYTDITTVHPLLRKVLKGDCAWYKVLRFLITEIPRPYVIGGQCFWIYGFGTTVLKVYTKLNKAHKVKDKAMAAGDSDQVVPPYPPPPTTTTPAFRVTQ